MPAKAAPRFIPLPPHAPRAPRSALARPAAQNLLGCAVIACIVLISAIAVLGRFWLYAL